MKQYLGLLDKILKEGDYKPAARENMPGTYSLFGEQLKFDLRESFPMITTKKVSFKNIVVELLWFLKGDTNIKYLVDNGCNIWNEDAYNYYHKFAKTNDEEVNKILQPVSLSRNSRDVLYGEHDSYSIMTFEEFCKKIRETPKESLPTYKNYILGDCGKQYGWLWRNWEGTQHPEVLSINTDSLTNEQLEEIRERWIKTISSSSLFNQSILIDSKLEPKYLTNKVDQIKDLIEGLKKSPFSRRHILTAWNPTTLQNMALNACHCFVQFNCRSLSKEERATWLHSNRKPTDSRELENVDDFFDSYNVPKYYLDCQLYQRSADVVLGVPYNISSYALLTHIIGKICNMIPRNFIHTFGDVHIYENHIEAAKEQIKREPKELPKLKLDTNTSWVLQRLTVIDSIMKKLEPSGFSLENYNPHPKLKNETKLSTGL